MDAAEYCREIESYLCRKNDGHLIRIVGPAFERVCAWYAMGVPLKVAFAGIDRHFERYYAKGPRRFPVRIDFCEGDVLTVFDDWRRAVGVAIARPEELSDSGGGGPQTGPAGEPSPRRRSTLPAHLDRIVTRLTTLRAGSAMGPALEVAIDRVLDDLAAAREPANTLRGEARARFLDRLTAMEEELLDRARMSIEPRLAEALGGEADEELAPFRERMTDEAFARARQAAMDRLLMDRLGLPQIRFD